LVDLWNPKNVADLIIGVNSLAMTIAIGADHAGYEMKAHLIDYLEKQGHEVTNYGTDGPDSVDYPDFAHAVASAVQKGKQAVGIILCGSANGVAMAANKHQGIRAAIAWSPEIAGLAKTHNDANVLCLPSRYIPNEVAEQCVDAYLGASFEGGRHARRVDKIPC
jgi:ribose 5-phosphate isomerase B